jgi:hypothetical protein
MEMLTKGRDLTKVNKEAMLQISKMSIGDINEKELSMNRDLSVADIL